MEIKATDKVGGNLLLVCGMAGREVIVFNEEKMKEKKEKKAPAAAAAGGKKKKAIKEAPDLHKQLAEKQDALLRALAAEDNYRKRAAREIEDTRKFANEELMRELLPVLDSLEMALPSIRASEKAGPLLEGTEMTLRQLNEVLGKFGLARIDCLKKKFDPRYHHAVLQEETSAYEDGQVMEVFRAGYMLRERVIRASEVKVAKRAEAKKKKK